MAGGAAISTHNAFKGRFGTDTFIDTSCSSTTDVTSSFLGNATAGTDTLLLIILKLRLKRLETWV